ncbi:MAG TPA: type VI secretion system tube protein Hcp [Methylomirabilota bacterium]|nr:type VI secretion system tube protein Hcp [Methylomirabilota bacterium]
MTSSIFLKLTDVKGESQVDGYDEHIDVLAWSWGCSNSGTTHIGQGSGGGASHFQDLSITKYVDSSSPTLTQFVASGKHIAEGELICTRAGNTTDDAYVPYLKIEFKDALISSQSEGGSNGESILTENVSINFGAFKKTYIQQETDGTAGTEIPVEWDIAAKKAAF